MRPTVDPEQLAALLDGRLDQAARKKLLEKISASDADLEVFASAAFAMEGAEVTASSLATDNASRDVVDNGARSTRRRRWRPAGFGMIAAAVLAVVVVPLLGRARRPTIEDPARHAAGLRGFARGVPANSWSIPPWAARRGAAVSLPEDVRDARIGALLTDLEMAIAQADTSSGSIAAAIAELLESSDAPGVGPIAGQYRDAANVLRSNPRATDLGEARAALVEVLRSVSVDEGAWAEAARLAAIQHNAPFFESATTREMLAPRLRGESTEAVAARSELRDALETPRASLDWNRVSQATTAFVRAICQ
jgi:hypothetical protein